MPAITHRAMSAQLKLNILNNGLQTIAFFRCVQGGMSEVLLLAMQEWWTNGPWTGTNPQDLPELPISLITGCCCCFVRSAATLQVKRFQLGWVSLPGTSCNICSAAAVLGSSECSSNCISTSTHQLPSFLAVFLRALPGSLESRGASPTFRHD